jgi:manganese/iron transport system permease protein
VLEAFAPVVAAAVLGGGSAGMLGVFVVGLRMPFLAVASAHAALAGAVFGTLLGAPPGVSAFAGALAGAALLGLLVRRRDVDPGAALGTLFSLMLGLAFLGMGLSPGPKSEALSLMWGSLLFVTPAQLGAMAAVLAGLLAFTWLFGRELRLVLYSRELAAAIIPEGLVFTGVLLLSAAVITVNLQTVGGLLLYSLISNPALAALALARSFRSALGLGSALGAASAVAGFAAAWAFDLPAGACIVLASSAVVAAALALSRALERR